MNNGIAFSDFSATSSKKNTDNKDMTVPEEEAMKSKMNVFKNALDVTLSHSRLV